MRLLYRIGLSFLLAPQLQSQTLGQRIARAPEGEVRMQVDSRAGVCGDGRDVVGYRSAIFARNFESMGGHWSTERCVPGPLRVAISVSDGEVTRVRTQVGGSWPATAQRVTDLGAVPAADASAYFFDLARRLDRGGKDRVIIPAVLADVPAPIQPLLSLARDTDRTTDLRRAAVQWVGLLGDASVVPALLTFAREDVDDDGNDRKAGKKTLGSSAVAALSMLDGDVGVPALMDLARNGSVGTRRNAVFWLGQNGDPRGRRMLHTVIEDANESIRVRAHAIFSLAHWREVPAPELAWLRGVYARLQGEELKKAVLQGMTNDEEPAAGRWMLDRVLDVDETRELRKTALFWAGQREETPTADIERVYRDVTDNAIREHAIFVLSQRSDDAAADALMRIAREDRDTRMRSKALFWLAQKDDPRARKLIADLVLKP
jgi:hypothetical protein